jgi:hypothetical protein
MNSYKSTVTSPRPRLVLASRRRAEGLDPSTAPTMLKGLFLNSDGRESNTLITLRPATRADAIGGGGTGSTTCAALKLDDCRPSAPHPSQPQSVGPRLRPSSAALIIRYPPRRQYPLPHSLLPSSSFSSWSPVVSSLHPGLSSPPHQRPTLDPLDRPMIRLGFSSIPFNILEHPIHRPCRPNNRP